MPSTLPTIRRIVFGWNRRVSVATLLLALSLGIVVRVATMELNPQAQLRSAEPLAFPGVFFLIVLPMVGGYILHVNRGLLPTFFVSFVPVYVFYGAARSAPPVVGAISSPPAPVNQPRVWKLSVLYWLLAIGVAVCWIYLPSYFDE